MPAKGHKKCHCMCVVTPRSRAACTLWTVLVLEMGFRCQGLPHTAPSSISPAASCAVRPEGAAAGRHPDHSGEM